MLTAVGIDPSLRRTAIAGADGTITVVDTANQTGMERLATIRDEVVKAVQDPLIGLVVIEGYSYGTPNAAHVLGELGGVLRLALWGQVPYIDVAPGTLKRYAAGHGRAKKEEVVANARERLGYPRFDNDEADALWLRTIGLDLLGHDVPVPKAHRDALKSLRRKLA